MVIFTGPKLRHNWLRCILLVTFLLKGCGKEIVDDLHTDGKSMNFGYSRPYLNYLLEVNNNKIPIFRSLSARSSSIPRNKQELKDMLYNKMLPDSLKVPVVVRVCNEDPEVLRKHQGAKYLFVFLLSFPQNERKMH